MEITTENWTYCSFSHENLKAMITLGASPEILEDSFLYYVTILDEDNNEIFQEEFRSLSKACSRINQKCSGIWNWTDAERPAKQGGCSTCVAH